MNFKTKLCAVASAMVMAASANAYAAIDLDADTGAVNFASELTIDTTNGTALTNAANIMDTTVNAGFVISDGVTHYVRFELPTGVTFTGIPALSVDDSSGADGNGAATATLTAGGAGEEFAIFSVTPSAGNTVAVANDVDLTVTTGLTVKSQDPVTISYAMYETAGNAVNETAGTSLATESGSILTFTAGLTVAATTPTVAAANQIDVTQNSQQFVNAGGANVAYSPIGDLTIAAIAGNQFIADGATDITLAAALAAGTQLTLAGDFTCTQNDDGTYTGAALNRVYIDNDGTCDNVNTAANAITASTATFNIGAAGVAAGAQLCIAGEGTPVIPEGSYTGLHDVTANAGYTVADTTLTLGSLAKNGASDTINFLLKPTSAFTNLVRVTNSGTVSGDIFFTLINDAGANVQFNLSDVSGYASDALAAGASTGYINVADLYAAAQAADATFDNNGAQLRLNVDSTCTEIIANAFAMSKDNNVFSVIDSVDNATN